MLDRNFIRREPEAVKAGAQRKGIDVALSVDEWVKTDTEWRALSVELQAKQAQMNQISKSIGMLMGQGKKDEAEAAKAQTKELKDAIGAGEQQEREFEGKLRELELSFPNAPDQSVPDGRTAEENQVVREWGEKPQYAEQPQPHWEIAERLKLLDLVRGAKIAGSGVPLYTGMGARLQRALFNWMIDHQTLRNGYQDIYPPYLVNSASLFGTGQLPKFEEDLYKADEDLYLIPTAEVPVTNIYRDEILDNDMLTLRMAAFSGCFRKEAGAAGKDTRGLTRVHEVRRIDLLVATPLGLVIDHPVEQGSL